MCVTMEIARVTENKRRYLDLLLLGDEQESMVDRYLERGELFVLDDRGIKAVCVVTDEGDGVCEIKNLAVVPEVQRRGYGSRMVEYVVARYAEHYSLLLVGTGETPGTIGFYRSCGFEYSHRIENFFTEHYDHPIVEEGVRLSDMVYLRRKLR